MTKKKDEVRELAHHAKELVAKLETSLVNDIRVVHREREIDFFEIVATAAVIRQHEGFATIVDLVLMDRGDVAVTLLRPACEEFIVLRYLASIDRNDARALLCMLAWRDIDSALTAQHKYSGAQVMRELGLTKPYESHASRRPLLKNGLAKLRKKLEWPKGDAPSVWFMAKKAGEQKLYNFLYRATSRSVHFSVGELTRRCWGDPGKMTVDSNHFERYWARFALSWGVQLYLKVLILSLETFPEKEIGGNVDKRIPELAVKLGALGKMPIITADELACPFESSLGIRTVVGRLMNKDRR